MIKIEPLKNKMLVYLDEYGHYVGEKFHAKDVKSAVQYLKKQIDNKNIGTVYEFTIIHKVILDLIDEAFEDVIKNDC